MFGALLVGCGGELAKEPMVLNDAKSAVEASSPEAAAPPPLSDNCWIAKTCARGYEYWCEIPGGPTTRDGGLPNVESTASPTEPGFASFCGPAACVRSRNWDNVCPRSQAKSFTCPHNGTDGSTVGPPSGACSFYSRVGPEGVLFCCN